MTLKTLEEVRIVIRRNDLSLRLEPAEPFALWPSGDEPTDRTERKGLWTKEDDDQDPAPFREVSHLILLGLRALDQGIDGDAKEDDQRQEAKHEMRLPNAYFQRQR